MSNKDFLLKIEQESLEMVQLSHKVDNGQNKGKL